MQRAASARGATVPPRSAVASALAVLTGRLAGGDALARLLADRLEATADEAERERAVLDAMLPPVSVMTDATTTQLQWNAKARRDALAEFGAFTAAQLAQQRGARTANPHTTVSRWVKDGRVFAVDSTDGRLFPAFQFVDGEPRQVIALVLAEMAGALRGWELLLWFTGSSGWLDGARPVDQLSDDPDAVAAAAAYQAAVSED